MVRLADVHSARERIRDGIIHTPCKLSQAFGDQVPCELFWKFENLQRTGSFKDRGALNKILQLTEKERKQGVVTASAGNHAQAVAYHASRLGIASCPSSRPSSRSRTQRGMAHGSSNRAPHYRTA